MLLNLGLGMTSLPVLQRHGGGTPTPAISAPVLANLSSGWTTGQNPPAWQSAYTGVFGYNSFDGTGDQVKARWKLGGSGWTTTAYEGLDDELATGDAVAWPFLTDNSLSAGGVFEVQEMIGRDVGLPTEQLSAWSASWIDTLNPAIASVTPTGAGSATQSASTTAASFSGISVEAGTLLLVLTCNSVTGTLDSVPPSLTLTPTGGGSPITATLVQSGGRATGRRTACYVAPNVATTTYNVTGTRANPAGGAVLAWVTLLNADPTPYGTVAITFPSESNPHVTGSATVPAYGIAIGFFDTESATVCTVNSLTVFLVTRGLAAAVGSSMILGYRTDTGVLSFNGDNSVARNRGAIVFKALGT